MILKEKILIIKEIQLILDKEILKTPTGNYRNNLSNANIFLLKALEELEEYGRTYNKKHSAL